MAINPPLLNLTSLPVVATSARLRGCHWACRHRTPSGPAPLHPGLQKGLGQAKPFSLTTPLKTIPATRHEKARYGTASVPNQFSRENAKGASACPSLPWGLFFETWDPPGKG